MNAKNLNESEKPESRVTVNERRKYVVRQIRSRGVLSYARYNHKWNSPSSSTLKEDIKALNQLGFEIETVEAGGRRYLVDSIARNIYTKAHRTDLNARSKDAIGMVGASLLLGLPEKEANITKKIQRISSLTTPQTEENADLKLLEDELSASLRLKEQNPELTPCWSRTDIGRALDPNVQPGAGPQAKKVLRLLHHLWQEESICAYMDAGTTNDRVAGWLRDLLVPTVYSKLKNLHVCTNSPSIFNVLGEPEICIRTVVIGGTQIVPSEAWAGPYAEAFLNATRNALHFGISFIGAISIDTGRGEIFSDSQEESQLKTLACNNSSLRVILIDSSKFSSEPLGNAFCFSRIDPKQVDLIVTNRLPEPSSKNELSEKNLDDMVAKIRSMGVPVIQGNFGKDYVPEKELARGAEMRARIPFANMEDLILELDWQEDHQKNKCLELFVNAAVETFLTNANENKRNPEVMKIKMRFRELVEKTSLRAQPALKRNEQ